MHALLVPFLDKDFLDVAMSCDPQLKMCTPERMEKWILRKAFDGENNPYLPKSVLWRQKEQFSDGGTIPLCTTIPSRVFILKIDYHSWIWLDR